MTVRPPNLPAGPNALWDWMERRGQNQRETAEIIGMDHTVLNQILSGRRRPGLANAILIERASGIAVELWMPTQVDKIKKPIFGRPRKALVGKR